MLWDNKTFYPLYNENYTIKQTQENIEKMFKISIDNTECFNPYAKKMKSVSSYKLSQLQEIAKSFTIELTKVHNGKEKRKTKKELYDEIQIYVN